MKNGKITRFISALLMLALLLSLLPASVFAEPSAQSEEQVAEQTETQTEEQTSEILYSDLSMSFDQLSDALLENSGEATVTLRRGGNISQALTVTLLVYDNNANYGEDYRLRYNGEAIEKIEGSRSIYDAFRDEGFLNEGWMLADGVAESDADDAVESVSAAEMLAQLDELNALVARVPVTFAANESTIELTVELLDDALNEYDESFLLAVLDPEGEAPEGGQLLVTIADNEDAPTVTVLFDCEEELVADSDTGLATLVFSRVGDLATSTEALLYMDGEALGYVDFTPYQDTQIVYAEPGTYTLVTGEGYNVTTTTVTVLNSDGSTTVPEGADPDLDALPDSYASLDDEDSKATKSHETRVNTGWLPSWATGASGRAEYGSYITWVGRVSGRYSIYKHCKVDGVGHIDWFDDGANLHDLDTSGTWSRCKTGYVKVQSYNTYNMTGIGSIEVTGYVEGLDYSNIMKLWVKEGNTNRATAEVENSRNKTKLTAVAYLPDKFQGDCRIYVENNDPTKSDDGCHLYITNGFKANKRQYRILIDNPDALYYRGVGNKSIKIDSKSNEFFLYMGNSSKVNIAWDDNGMPFRLVGYRLKQGNLLSGVIPLSGSEFTFNEAFLKTYEKTYCYSTNKNGTNYSTFKVVPVFEKIETTVELETSAYGTIYIDDYNGEQLYKGEKITICGTPKTGASFYGVYYKSYEALSGSISQSGTQDAASTGKVTFSLGKYEKNVLQGAFNIDADRLMVNYGSKNPLLRHGKLAYDAGVVVQKEDYVKNDYFALMADADDGYITRWNSDGRYYYGDIFYYQLDGNPNHNWITVDFIRESSLSMATGTVSGVLEIYDMELRTATSSKKELKQKDYIFYGDHATYSGTTDDKGKYTLENFKGVKGGTYSVALVNGSTISYATFIPFADGNTKANTNITFSQFPQDSIYPSEISVALGSRSGNYIQLTSKTTGTITVRVTNEAGGKVLGVKLHFLSTNEDTFEKEMATFDLVYNEQLTNENDADLYSYWTMNVTDSSLLPPRSRMYVSVSAEKPYTVTREQFDSKGNYIGTTVSSSTAAYESGYVNSGYEVINAIADEDETIEQSVPDLPGAQNAYSTDSDLLVLPVLGSADFSMTSLTGGYYVYKIINGTNYLVCGYSITPAYGRSTLKEKYNSAKQTAQYLYSAKENTQMLGSANVQSNVLGESTGTTPGATAAQTQKKKPSNFTVYPAFMFKFAMTPGKDADGNDKTYLTAFEMVLGFDLYYLQNIPYTLAGFPFYLCVTTQLEAYAHVEHTMEPTIEPGGDTTLTLYDMCQDPNLVDEATVTDAGFFAAPTLSLGLKAGAGLNGFLSAFVNGTVSLPMNFQFKPALDVGGEFRFSISFGADLIFFTANYTVLSFEAQFGNTVLADELQQIQGFSTNYKHVTPMVISGDNIRVLADGETAPSAEEMMNNLSFSLMERPENGTNLFRSGTVDSTTLAENVFKNTKIHLVNLGNGSVMALFLEDNGEDGYNYLSAAYAISNDGGKTWSNINFVNSNIGQANTSLQYDINIFELNDRILITWSEADFNTLLNDLDPSDLTIAQLSALMNAMNLCGRFFDAETGEPIGEAFTIAENSTVACGALDAVQNGDTVYVYYQRNVFPTDEDAEVTDLMSTDRTIALARADINDPQTWTSTSVRALNQEGQQYRITEVVPFVHDGVMGEIVVIDRNGKLAVYDAENDEWITDNEDRQIFLRTYDFAEDGTPQPTALIALTDSDDCAQSPQVVSNDDYLHLFWNENGEIVYMTDFVATEQDNEDVQSGAIVVRHNDGTVTLPEHEAINGSYIAGSDTLNVGTTFTASMADDGNVLLSWIADDEADGLLLPTEEIYGVILNTVTNAEALIRSGAETAEGGNENVYDLWAVGAPIALTDDDSLIGALDSICLESGRDSKFLLAYTTLDADIRSEATSADIKAVQSVDAPDPVIDDVDAPDYPEVGSDMTVFATVTNYGLEPLNGVRVTAAGIGQTVSRDYTDTVMPGESLEVNVVVSVPADFNETTVLTLTVSGLNDQTDYADTVEQEVCYGAYFVIDDMSTLVSIPNSTDCEATTRLRNLGNAAGSPTLTFVNTVFGSDEYYQEYVFECDDVVEPNAEVYVVHVLEDTLMNKAHTANLAVYAGDGYDQSANSLMPVPVMETPEIEVTGTDTPDVPDESTEPSVEPTKPSVEPTEPSVEPTAEPTEPSVEPTEPSVEPTEPIETVFSDVAKHWAKDDISYVYNKKLMNGMGNGEFLPEDAVTRAMLVTVLYRLAGSPTVSETNPFSDVRRGQWYTDAILWAASNGVVEGYGNGKFGPNDCATREQIATVLLRYAKFTDAACDTSARSDLSGYKDKGKISTYATEAMAWANALGLIRGVTETTLCPTENATRAQLAAILRRYSELLR